ncbi:hypothetical protein [Agarilytica rhodophyticola]|uniref:hypothetical protein n=1 Tax=Agarilytica rhodophyticola TaxID=1737490 RepID=UPI000B341CC6|nr:hypothetical protein [Agarilytica rhodophyticola]
MKIKLPKSRNLLLDFFSMSVFVAVFYFNAEDIARFSLGDRADVIPSDEDMIYIVILSIVYIFVCVISLILTIKFFRFIAKKVFGIDAGEDYVEVDLSEKKGKKNK